MSAPLTLTSLGIDGEVFLRKLLRKHSWGSPDADPEERVKSAVDEIFLQDDLPYSLFRVASDEELRRAILGFNSGRTSLRSDVAWLLIRPDEFDDFGITPIKSPGDTKCRFANDLHFDIIADQTRLESLCRQIMTTNRPILSLRKSHLEPWISQARDESCLSHPDSVECKVVNCPPINNLPSQAET